MILMFDIFFITNYMTDIKQRLSTHNKNREAGKILLRKVILLTASCMNVT